MQHITQDNFDTEVKRPGLPALVMFYAVWCSKCAMMKSIAEEMEDKYGGRIRFLEVDIEESKKLGAEYNTDIVPTFVLFKNGEIQGVMKGIIGEQVFEQRIKRVL